MPSLWEPMTLEEALARIEELETIETANKTAIAGKQRKARPRGAVGRETTPGRYSRLCAVGRTRDDRPEIAISGRSGGINLVASSGAKPRHTRLASLLPEITPLPRNEQNRR